MAAFHKAVHPQKKRLIPVFGEKAFFILKIPEICAIRLRSANCSSILQFTSNQAGGVCLFDI